MNNVYQKVLEFKRRFPGTIAWRLKKHAKIIEKHINPDEEVRYVFCGQENDQFYNIFTTCILTLTNKRILMAKKRVLYGYSLTSITPDMYNDMEIYEGLIWGKLVIDTIKEKVIISNLSKKSLTEIETEISTLMMEEKQKYVNKQEG